MTSERGGVVTSVGTPSGGTASPTSNPDRGVASVSPWSRAVYPTGTKNPNLPMVDIVREGHTIREVRIDGHKMRGVQSIQTSHQVGNPPTVTISFVAEDIIMRDAGPVQGAPLAGSYNGVVRTESYQVEEGAVLVGSQEVEESWAASDHEHPAG